METKRILSEAELARRKTIAVWVLGCGALFAALPLLFGRVVLTYLLPDTDLYDLANATVAWGISFAMASAVFGFCIVMGLGMVRHMIDRRISNFVRYWLLLVIYLGWYTIPLLLFALNYFGWFDQPLHNHVAGAVCWLVGCLSWQIGLIGTIDTVRVRSRDPEAVSAVRMIQGALVALIGLTFVAESMMRNLDYNLDFAGTIEGLLPLPGKVRFLGILYYILPCCYIVLFFGLKRLLGTSLFASTPAEYEACNSVTDSGPVFSFSSRVFGALAAAMLCIGLTLLITFHWNEIYTF